jgi:hypothetical protein
VKKTKRRTPTKFHTPVIAGRVPESLHQQIKQAAKKSGRTMSDELAWRAGRSFEWERVFGDFDQARKSLGDILRGQAEAALTRLGWGTTSDLQYGGRIWLPPGRHNFPKSGWLDPDKPSPPVPPPEIIPEPWVKDLDDAINRKIEQALDRAVDRIVERVKAVLNDREHGK